MIGLALLVGVITFFVTIFMLVRDEGWYSGWFLIGGFMGLLAGVITFMVCMVTVIIAMPQDREVVSKSNIVNIRDDSAVSGQFFLFAGSIDDEAVFRYYQENNGHYQLKTVEAWQTTIIEDDSQPRVVTTAEFSRYDWAFWPQSAHEFDPDGRHARYVIHIPKGSIKQQFTLGE